MGSQVRRYIGQILRDGGFLSSQELDRACEEQKHTKELLGQVLVRMGVLKARDISAPLLVQGHLSTLDDAVKIAAGERQLLGALLVRSGQITAAQLDSVIAEQKKTGEKLGEVFTRRGMVTERQLAALLEFQHNQEETTSASPLRLGELLVATGYISRDQLQDSLGKQSISHKKIGEVLVEEGYISPSRIKKGFHLQKMLVNAALAAVLSLSLSAPGFAADVSLQWDANMESDLAGYKVYYSADSSALASSTPVIVSAPTTIASISGLDPAKSYTFAVTAYNSDGLESSFSNSVTIGELVAPTVAITSPAISENVSGTVSIIVDASDNVGVTRVEFYVGGVLHGSDSASPYTFSWNTLSLTPGSYTLMAKAYDAAGNVSQSSRTVTVVNDTIAPVVALTSPANNTSFNGTVTISSSATDNVGVTRVDFICNGVLLYTSNVAPYRFNWDTTTVGNGNYVINAKAFDNAGHATESSSVTVTVDNAAPAVSGFSLPTVSASLTVPVSGLAASDNNAVTGYLITESATAPAAGAAGWSAAPTSFTFSAAGAKTAYAWAKDAVGNVSTARSAIVNIDLTAPAVSSSFSLPTISASLTVPVSGLTASDSSGVTGYLITESATAPAAGAAGWSATAPTSFTFSAAGTKTAYAWAKDAVGNISSARTATVSIDLTAPAVNTTFALPAISASLTVPVSGLNASDGIGVTGYLVTESATAPAAGAAGWSATAPTSFTFSAAGTKTAYAWAKDAVGNISSARSAIVNIDLTAPAVSSSFSLPSISASLTVPVSGLTASDSSGVTGYLVTESATVPAAGAAGWSATAPTSFTFSAEGTKTAYAWAKDAAGNVSTARSATVSIDLAAPAVSTTFSLPAISASLTVPVSGLNASDGIGVTGYLITESATAPAAGAAGWSATAPTSFTFSAAGTKTAYAWAKDAVGNVSIARTATVSIDLTAPAVNTTFALPAISASLTVPVSGLTASDGSGVTGYLITESATVPAAGAAGWSATAPTSFTFSTAGTKTAYAWAKDAVGNVSIARTATVSIDLTAPAVNTTFALPAISASLTVPVSGLTASDSSGVTGYLITESATAPAAGAAGWSATAPTSFTFSAEGTKTVFAWAKDAAGNVSTARSATVSIDLTAPTLNSSFALPAISASLTVPVSGLSATDNIGVVGYLITENATAPVVTAAGWSATAPTSFTFSAEGAKTAYAWTKDNAGNVSTARSATVSIDLTAPVVNSFALPVTSASLTVPVTGIVASDNIAVTGYLLTESAMAPSVTAAGWSVTAPTSVTFSTEGTKTVYAWVKDDVGNVSTARTASVSITLPDLAAPTLNSFALPATATSLTVPVTGLAASDTIGVTGYLITESATAPTAATAGWSTAAPTSFTFSAEGSKTAYAWAKDAAGNISSARMASVSITLPDLAAPTLNSFALPATATSLTVPVTGLAASDTIGVTGYLITESATAPTAATAGWSTAAPTSFTFSAEGSKTAYAWAKDAAGNISSTRTASVSITLPLPTKTNLSISDALRALQIGSGKVIASPAEMARLDVAPVLQGKSAPDGKVNTGDAIVILSKIVGKIAS